VAAMAAPAVRKKWRRFFGIMVLFFPGMGDAEKVIYGDCGIRKDSCVSSTGS